MAEARVEADWNRTAAQLCQIANLLRGKGKRAFSPDEFHPMHARRARAGSRLTGDVLRAINAAEAARKGEKKR